MEGTKRRQEARDKGQEARVRGKSQRASGKRRMKRGGDTCMKACIRRRGKSAFPGSKSIASDIFMLASSVFFSSRRRRP
jgi:hypothetical protein